MTSKSRGGNGSFKMSKTPMSQAERKRRQKQADDFNAWVDKVAPRKKKKPVKNPRKRGK